MSTTEKKLEQQIILVTGAAEGLGRELSLALAKQGATVILLDHQVPLLEQLYDDIVNAACPEPAIYPMQLAGAIEEDFFNLAETVKQTFGRLDGLIHNAALFKSFTPLPQFSYDSWSEILQVNLNAPFLLSKACLPLLKEADHALLMFMTDRVNTETDNYAYRGAYGVSKAGLDELALTLKDELEENTHISVISHDPGPMQTRLRARMSPGQRSNEVALPETSAGTILELVLNSIIPKM